MSRAFIGIGSNVDRRKNIADALATFRARYCKLTLSEIYESEAVGFDGDNFYNLVIGLDTKASPQALSAQLRQIEANHGRRRDDARFAPRTLDLDLLLFDDLILRDDDINVPRKDITEYAFVLRPLAEIAGDQRHPESGVRFRDLWHEFETAHEVGLRIVATPLESKRSSMAQRS